VKGPPTPPISNNNNTGNREKIYAMKLDQGTIIILQIGQFHVEVRRRLHTVRSLSTMKDTAVRLRSQLSPQGIPHLLHLLHDLLRSMVRMDKQHKLKKISTLLKQLSSTMMALLKINQPHQLERMERNIMGLNQRTCL